MATILSVNSFRRGTGKSTLVANTAVLLALDGQQIGIVDMDLPSPSQQTLFGLADDEIKFTLNDFLWGNCEIEQTAIDLTPRLALAARVTGRAHLVAASQRPSEIARALRGDYFLHLLNDGFDQLAETLGLDTILIDTHAGLTEETLLVFGLSDTVAVLLRNDALDYQGTAVTVDIIRQLDIPRANLVVNELSPLVDPALAQQQIAQTYNCDVIGLLPHSPDLAELGSRGLFVLRQPAHPLTAQLRQIAARMIT